MRLPKRGEIVVLLDRCIVEAETTPGEIGLAGETIIALENAVIHATPTDEVVSFCALFKGKIIRALLWSHEFKVM